MITLVQAEVVLKMDGRGVWQVQLPKLVNLVLAAVDCKYLKRVDRNIERLECSYCVMGCRHGLFAPANCPPQPTLTTAAAHPAMRQRMLRCTGAG